MEVKAGYKQTDVGVIPQEWDERPLGELIEKLEAGISVNSVDEEASIYVHDQSVLKTSCVLKGKFYAEECKKIHPREISRAKLNPRKDTIIISRMNTPELVGECGYVNQDFKNLFLPDRLWSTRFKKGSLTNAHWLSYILSYGDFNKAIKDIATGTSGSMKNISKNLLLNIKIPFPNLIEQTAIANSLSDTDDLINTIENLIAKKRNIKKGAMQKLLQPKEGWELKMLGEVCEIRKGEQLNRSTLNENDPYPVYNGGILPSGYTSDWNQIEKTIIISEGGNSCGYINFVRTKFWQGGHCYSLTTKLNIDFFFQLLKAFEKEIMALRVGSGLPNIQRNRLIEFKIFIPKSEEQTRIATILSYMDIEILALESKLEKYKNLKLGMMQTLLTGKIRLV